MSESVATELLRTARSVLVIDWPSRDVPVCLARAGFEVVVRGGPGPDAFSVYGVEGDKVTVRQVGKPPEKVDFVYCHRPLAELAGIVGVARTLGARAIWCQSGLSAEGVREPAGCWLPPAESRTARATVEAAGLQYVQAPYIVDALRELA